MYIKLSSCWSLEQEIIKAIHVFPLCLDLTLKKLQNMNTFVFEWTKNVLSNVAMTILSPNLLDHDVIYRYASASTLKPLDAVYHAADL